VHPATSVFPTMSDRSRFASAFRQIALVAIVLAGAWQSALAAPNDHAMKLTVVAAGDETVLKGSADDAASVLFKKQAIVVNDTPWLNWSWRVENTFGDIDEQSAPGDDFPARIYVVVRTGVLPWETKAINYVWSSSSPIDTHWANPFTEKSIMVAIRSGSSEIGQWRHERRNVVEDFRNYFGLEVDKIDGYAIMVDADNTGKTATAFFGGMPALAEISNDRWHQLSPHINYSELSADEILFEAGSRGDDLYLVIEGEIALYLDNIDAGGERFYLHSRGAGQTVGDFAVLNGGDHLVSSIAKKHTYMATFPREAFELLIDIHPTLIEAVYDTAAALSHRVMMSRIYLGLFGNMPTQAMNELLSATEMRNYRNGDVLFNQHDEADGLHVVVSGRMHVEICRGDGVCLFNGEIFAPEPVGELAMLSNGKRSATVIAARESTVAFLNREAFDTLIAQRANRVLALSRVVVQRHANTIAPRKRSRDRTFVIVPLDENLPMRRVSQQLKRAMREFANPLVLDSHSFDRMYGRLDAAQTRVDDTFNSSISRWLEDKENNFGGVVYIADPSWTPWTRRCLHRADRVLYIADASENGELGGSGSPQLRAIESQVDDLFSNPHTRPRRELILLHPEHTQRPKKTIEWLKSRQLDTFYHVRLDDKAHLARLSRRLYGRARGIVFSGGGARGYAHLGVLRWIEENDTDIDYIGGSSMGALMGASLAIGQSIQDITHLSSQFASKRALFDYTLPLASLLKSNKLTQFCKVVFGDQRIEDSWVPFFCVSSSLSDGQEVIHDRGPLWLAIRSTVSLPGLFSPVPTDDGQLLIDGAVLNTFPVDIMRHRLNGRGEVIGVNVSQISEVAHGYDFGTYLSGWAVLWSRLNPFQRAARVPRLVETLLRSTDIKGIERLHETLQELDLLIEPDVSEISLLDFKSYARISDIGYEAAREAFAEYDVSSSAGSRMESVMASTLHTSATNR